MKRKILFVGHGQSIHIKKWTDYFESQGYECILANFSFEDITKVTRSFNMIDKAPNVSGGNYQYLLKVGKLAELIKTYKPDYINAHYSYSMGLIAVLALHFVKEIRSQIHFSVVCHGSDILAPPIKRITNMINSYVLKQADAVFCVSNQIMDKVQAFGVDSGKIYYGLYGVEGSYLHNSEQNKDIDIISYRSYVPNSRLDELFRVLGQKAFKNRKIFCIVPLASQKKLQEFRDQYPHIQFFPELTHDEIIFFAKRARIYVSATKSDGTSLSLLEALDCGCVPIVSNIPSNREWIVDGVNGFLYRSFKELFTLMSSAIEFSEEEFKRMRSINELLINRRALYSNRMVEIEQILKHNG